MCVCVCVYSGVCVCVCVCARSYIYIYIYIYILHFIVQNELLTTSFIESKGVACSNSVSHNRVQVLNIPVLLRACSQDCTGNLQMIVSLEA